MKTYIAVLCTVLFIPTLFCVQLNVECEWMPYQKQFPKIFSLDIFRNDTPLVHLGEDKPPKKLDSQEIVQGYSGVITNANWFLSVNITLECVLVSEIECELFGMRSDSEDYQNFRFKPRLAFYVGPRSPEIKLTPNTEPYDIGSLILVTCTTRVGRNVSSWIWTVEHTEQRSTKHTEFQPVSEDAFDTSTIVRSECSYLTTSKYVFIPSKAGETKIRCEVDGMFGTEISITVGSHKEYLSTNLFLSSFLVYIHFIILPFAFALCGDRVSFRKPERLRMRTFRTIISFFIGIAFFTWWLAIIMDSKQKILSYAMFAVLELVFIAFYTFTRFSANLSRCFEKKRRRFLYNARIASSCCAVMTPVICWTMIKCNGGSSILGLEIVFWILTGMSFLGFVCVSKNREETYWEIEEKIL